MLMHSHHTTSTLYSAKYIPRMPGFLQSPSGTVSVVGGRWELRPIRRTAFIILSCIASSLPPSTLTRKDMSDSPNRTNLRYGLHRQYYHSSVHGGACCRTLLRKDQHTRSITPSSAGVQHSEVSEPDAHCTNLCLRPKYPHNTFVSPPLTSTSSLVVTVPT